MFRQLAAATIAGCVGIVPAGASLSGSAAGHVEVTMNGEVQTWPMVEADDGAPDPELHFRDFGFVWQASILAVGPMPAEVAQDDVGQAPTLVINFSGFNGDITATEASIVLITWPDGRRYVSGDDDDDLVFVEALDLNDDVAVTEGRFGAMLCFREHVFAAHDLEDCIEIAGRFNARLPRDDG